MRLLDDFYHLTLYLGKPASVGYMVYGALAREPAAFIEGMFSALTFNHLYQSEKKSNKKKARLEQQTNSKQDL